MIIKNIAKEVQEKLKAKEIAMSRKSSGANEQAGDNLTYADMTSRSTFVRMVSNKAEPVIIQGGVLDIDKKTKFGYSQIYEQKSNSQIKGISGIKNISVEYQGGYKGIRKATVNWIVNSLDDLDLYEPHFLTIGKSVLLEWGWVYKDPKKNIKKTFYDFENGINQEIFTNPMPLILQNNGDYDAIGGVVSNFDYKLNEDGGFDCNTILTSVGISFMGSQKIAEDSDSYKIITNEESEDSTTEPPDDNLLNAVLNIERIVVHKYWKLQVQDNSRTLQHSVIGSPGKGTLAGKMLGSNATSQFNMISKNLHESHGSGLKGFYNSVIIGAINTLDILGLDDAEWLPDEQLAEAIYSSYGIGLFDGDNTENKQTNVYVRWGWFEDNILSRYTVYGDKDKKPAGYFRSIEYDRENETYSPVLIRNSPHLYPINPLAFFLPGQSPLGGGIRDKTREKDTDTQQSFQEARTTFKALFSINSKNNFKFDDYGRPGSNSLEHQYGNIRNIMVNTKEIKKAFGIDADKVSLDARSGYVYGTTTINPPQTLDAAINNLLGALNSNFHNYWDLKLTEDPYTKHKKIIDAYSTAKIQNKKFYTTFDNKGKVSSNGPGIYKFPSFKLGSIVKSQELNYKIPNSVAVAAMYGSNESNANKIIKTDNKATAGLNVLAASDRANSEYDDFGYKGIRETYTKFPRGDGGKPDPKLGHSIGTSNSAFGSEYNVELDKKGSFVIDVANGEKTKWWHKFSSNAGANEHVSSQQDQEKKAEQERIKSLNSKFRTGLKEANLNQGAMFYELDLTSEVSTPDVSMYSAGISILNERLYNITTDTAKYQSDFLLPAELSIEIDGTGGITPGDVFHVDYISSKYNKELIASGSNIPLGPKTFFQTFNIVQTVDDNGWNTSLETKMRVNGAALNTVPLPDPPEIEVVIEDLRESLWAPASASELRLGTATSSMMDKAILDELNKFVTGSDPNYNTLPDLTLFDNLVKETDNLVEAMNRDFDESERNRRLQEEENKTKKLVETFIKLDTDDNGEETKKSNEKVGAPHVTGSSDLTVTPKNKKIKTNVGKEKKKEKEDPVIYVPGQTTAKQGGFFQGGDYDGFPSLAASGKMNVLIENSEGTIRLKKIGFKKQAKREYLHMDYRKLLYWFNMSRVGVLAYFEYKNGSRKEVFGIFVGKEVSGLYDGTTDTTGRYITAAARSKLNETLAFLNDEAERIKDKYLIDKYGIKK